MEFRMTNDYERLKEIINSDGDIGSHGYVYILELSNGKTKVGKSFSIVSRIRNHLHTYKKHNINILRMAVSMPLLNYSYVEDVFHLALGNFHSDTIGCETYDISFDDVMHTCVNAIEIFHKQLYGQDLCLF